MPDGGQFLAELEWRGLIQDQSEGLQKRLSQGAVSGYVGFDPTAPSLHVGHLIPIFGLVHLQRAGGRPVVVIGGATGMIGDPSGRSSERNLLDDETLSQNVAGIRRQLERFLDFASPTSGAVLLNNRDWLEPYGVLQFLRDIGKHFTVSYLLDKESVQSRMERGMSFTEFSYSTLQATDFLHLYREHQVELQMGAADQWGNITAGLELIRRVEGRGDQGQPQAYALSLPLLLTGDGVKMGKTDRGAIYLDPALTSPFTFYQFWLNQDDLLVPFLLRRMTLMPRYEIAALEADQRVHPSQRRTHRALAFDLTARVHGREEAQRQVRVADAAFSGVPIRDPSVLEVLYENLDHFDFTDADMQGDVLTLAVSSGMYPSRSEARRSMQQGSFWINDKRAVEPDGPVPELVGGVYLVLRSGKKTLRIGRLRREPEPEETEPAAT